jgi:hypothetical protein
MKGHSRYGGESRPQLYLVLWTGAAFLAGVSLGLLGHIPNHIDWGDAATWIGSIATSGALVFAFWQLQSERQTRRSESKAAAQRDARAQAERIAAWFEDDWLYVLNGSQLPISGVALEVTAIWLGGLYESRLILLTTAPPGLVRTPCGSPRSCATAC